MSNAPVNSLMTQDGSIAIPLCSNPVFIIGSPRSGTSILAWSLASHSTFWTSAESDLLFYIFGEGRFETAYERTMARADSAWLRQEGIDRQALLRYVGLGFNALFTSRSQGKRWIDQTPVYTLVTDLLYEMFPGAYFIHIVRDGRRVVHSMINFANAFANESTAAEMRRAGRLPDWASDFRDACRTWTAFVSSARAFGLQHPDRVLTVVNEDLVQDPRGGFERILDFLGAHHEEAPMRFFQTNRINSSFPKGGQSPDPRIASWEAWPQEQKGIFIEECGDTLVELGFAREDELLVACEPDSGRNRRA